MPIGRDREQRVEQKRDRDQAHGFYEPKAAKPADQGQDRTPGVDGQRDRRADGVEPRNVRPRAGQLPRSRSNRCAEWRRSRTPRRQSRSGPRNTGAPPAPSARAPVRLRRRPRRSRLEQHDGGVEGERKQRRAAEPQRHSRPARKKRAHQEPSSPCLCRSPICVRSRGLLTEVARPPSMALAGRPIAAQYGVYAHSCGYNCGRTVARADRQETHDCSTIACFRSP